MSLPSPNIQSAKSELSSENQNKSKQSDDLSEELNHTQGPDSTQLVRRGALVPPKIDDPMEPDDDDDDGDDEALDEAGYEPDLIHSVADSSAAAANISQLSGHQARQFPRRSSVVVIPPMQVCPGDLLVYSKALTQRGNFPGM